MGFMKSHLVFVMMVFFLSFMILTQSNAHSAQTFVYVNRTITIELDELKGNENPETFLRRMSTLLKTNFTLDKNDITYKFLESYLQSTINEHHNLFGEPIILSNEYNSKEDMSYGKLRIHYFNKKKSELEPMNLSSKIRISNQSGTQPEILIEFENSFDWVSKQLINLFISFGDGTDFILASSSIKLSVSKKHSNAIQIDSKYKLFGSHVKDEVVEDESRKAEKASRRLVNEFRL